MRYFIELAYDGTAYHGWQTQPGSASIQELVELGLKYKAGLAGRITGCGRTDTGVHARQFFAHFDLDCALDKGGHDELVWELNNYLPRDIAIRRIFSVNENAHARFDAISRTYSYHIATFKNPFDSQYLWHVHIKPDFELMNRAAAILLENTDFTSFSKLHTDVKTNNCRVTHAQWTDLDDKLTFTITADRFLRNMVRAIVGTLIDVGRGKISIEVFKTIVESKNRQNAGMSVPAHALFLDRVEYDWQKIL